MILPVTDFPPLRARAAVEALRAGVVTRDLAQLVICGRKAELACLASHVDTNDDGSAQIVVGEYGAGKSHLCEALAARLVETGYAVARIELGAANGRAENPRGVVASIEEKIALRVGGRLLRGSADLSNLLLALLCDRIHSGPDAAPLRAIHARHPGPDGLLARFDAIRQHMPRVWAAAGLAAERRGFLSDSIPTAMTAANRAAAALNVLAHLLSEADQRGLVLLFDEAERAEWAPNDYRLERARDFIIGMAYTALNLDTAHLKHYLDDHSKPYRPLAPSRLHAVFAFSYRWGLAYRLARDIGVEPLELPVIGTQERRQVAATVVSVYAIAYGKGDACLAETDLERIEQSCRGEDLRSFVRALVAALDWNRVRARYGA